MTYNAAAPLVTPTYDGSGQAIHPDVVDMVQKTGSPWQGFRYWMAMTPYPGGNDDYENPSILASNDRVTWVVPQGLTNPIDPDPGGAAYNSDTDLEWDAENGRMLCYWRHYTGSSGQAGNLTFCYSQSTNGTAWTPQADMFSVTYPDPSVAQLSPAVVRVGPGDWRMWSVGNGGPSQVRTSTTGTGPWSEGVDLRFNGATYDSLIASFWHWGIVEHNGGFYGLASTMYQHIYALSSADGIDWSVNTTPVLNSRAGEWDAQLYRPTLVVDGSYVRVWYSANNGARVWRTGYTTIPASEWPTVPGLPPIAAPSAPYRTDGKSATLYRTDGEPATTSTA